jgi:mannosyltransferase OCH1-like enzyme
MIPKIIHNIWVQGYSNIPDDIRIQQLQIKKLNPDWEFIIWDEKMILQLLEKYPNVLRVYKECVNYSGLINYNATKSDIARYVIMKEYGGLYYDLDFTCVSSFNKLFENNTHIVNNIYTASSEIEFLKYIYPFQKPMYCSCFMALQKGHPVWEKILDLVIKATNKQEIGEAFDKILQINENNYNIIRLTKVRGHYECNTDDKICFTPTESSWNFIRPILKIINCNLPLILVLILILIIIRIIKMK